MCHVLLALPLLALPVFWVFPAAAAVPIYGVAIVLSGTVYWYAMVAMKRPMQNGTEGMIGEFGIVVECQGCDVHVQARNELWQATSNVPLRKGDHVKVITVDQLTLRVQKLEGDAFHWWQPISPLSH